MRFQQITKILAGVVMGAILGAPAVASAAISMFMKLDGIQGESNDFEHRNEIDVLSWSWGAARLNNQKCASVQDISFTKYVDVATTRLITNVGTGQHIPNARLTVRKGGESPIEFLVLELSNVIVSSVSTDVSGAEDRLTENVTLSFGAMKVTYTPQSLKGLPGGPRVGNIASTCLLPPV